MADLERPKASSSRPALSPALSICNQKWEGERGEERGRDESIKFSPFSRSEDKLKYNQLLIDVLPPSLGCYGDEQ